MSLSTRGLAVVLSLLIGVSCAEWVSDVGGTSARADQQALSARAERFWETVRSAAEQVDLNEYEELLDSVEGVLGALPQENAKVVALLRSSAKRLRRASQAIFLNAIAAGEAAGERLTRGFLAPRNTEVALSALGDVFGHAIRRFRAGETAAYDEKALREVAERQGEVLPILKQSAELSGDVLTDCRLASKEAWDVLKYDLYTPGAPKTPQAAEDLAWKLEKAAAGIRRRFTGFVIQSVQGVAEDEATKADAPNKVLLGKGLSSGTKAAAAPTAAAMIGPPSALSAWGEQEALVSV